MRLKKTKIPVEPNRKSGGTHKLQELYRSDAQFHIWYIVKIYFGRFCLNCLVENGRANGEWSILYHR